MAQYRPDAKILTLGPEFYDAVEPARFPEAIPHFLNRRWAERVGLDTLMDQAWQAHFCRFEPLPVSYSPGEAIKFWSVISTAAAGVSPADALNPMKAHSKQCGAKP